MIEHTAFVPVGESSRDTAVLLVGTAHEYGIPQDHIKKVPGGFRITEDLADVLYSDSDGYTESNPEPSGQTAGRKNSKEESL